MSVFDLNQNPDLTQQLSHSYPSMNVTSVQPITDNGDTIIQANFMGGGSTPNLVYTKSNVTVNFKASKLFIVGNVHKNNGVSYSGELIIKNDPLTNAASTPSIYMCFILSYNSSAPATDIDKIINSKGSSPIQVDLNKYTESSGDMTYVLYNASNTNGIPCVVAIFSNPIQINTDLAGFATKIDSLFTTSKGSLTYSIVKNKNEGEWMECDYVPIDSESVATYSLPIQSSLIKDSNSLDTMRTTIMFVTFFIICVFAYFLIPTIYLAILSKVFKDNTDGEKKKKTILYMDYVLSFLIGGTALILICVGAFSDPTKVDNVGDILLAGFSLSIVYIISYIIIQAKKLGGGVFIPGVNYGKKKEEEGEGEEKAAES
jgi:hypothetical protein